MAERKNMIGVESEFYKVIRFGGLDKRKQAIWICQCICGKLFAANGHALRRGSIISCGCRRGGRRDFTGQIFHHAKVLGFDRVDKNRQARWWVECLLCGKIFSTLGNSLARGLVKSCGCLRRQAKGGTPPINRTHGESPRRGATKEYRVWKNMRARCDDPNTPYYKNYGGRGINYCVRWRDYQNFLEDMGRCPPDKESIDRIDNDGGYWCGKCEECLGHGRVFNCRWATREEQSANQRHHNRHMKGE